MNQYFMKTAFAVSGDQTVIPQSVNLTGLISMTQGWGPDYALDPAVNAGAKDIDRASMNWLFFAVTQNIQQYQTFGTPEFISSADNGGVAYSYSKNARVRYQVTPSDPWRVYTSKVDANTSLPTVAANWIRDDEWLTASQIAATYLNATTAASTYLTQGSAAGTYQTLAGMSNYATTSALSTVSNVASNAASTAGTANSKADTALSRSCGTTPSGNLYPATRAFNTLYTNNTGRTLFLNVGIVSATSSGSWDAYGRLNGSNGTNGVEVARGNVTSNTSRGNIIFWVPAGATYSVSSAGNILIDSWYEIG